MHIIFGRMGKGQVRIHHLRLFLKLSRVQMASKVFKALPVLKENRVMCGFL